MDHGQWSKFTVLSNDNNDTEDKVLSKVTNSIIIREYQVSSANVKRGALDKIETQNRYALAP